MPEAIIARRYYVSGLVQGVGFRYATVRVARRLGLVGYVRNLPDGRVEVLAEGSPESVRELENWLHHGPPMARVDHLERHDVSPTGTFHDFEIRF